FFAGDARLRELSLDGGGRAEAHVLLGADAASRFLGRLLEASAAPVLVRGMVAAALLALSRLLALPLSLAGKVEGEIALPVAGPEIELAHLLVAALLRPAAQHLLHLLDVVARLGEELELADLLHEIFELLAGLLQAAPGVLVGVALHLLERIHELL